MLYHYQKCTQCGEEYLTGETLQNIEHIIKQVKGMLLKLLLLIIKKLLKTVSIDDASAHMIKSFL